jgi:hypothetical protein
LYLYLPSLGILEAYTGLKNATGLCDSLFRDRGLTHTPMFLIGLSFFMEFYAPQRLHEYRKAVSVYSQALTLMPIELFRFSKFLQHKDSSLGRMIFKNLTQLLLPPNISKFNLVYFVIITQKENKCYLSSKWCLFNL